MMDEFVKTVQEMRKYQKEYFKTRDKAIPLLSQRNWSGKWIICYPT